MFIVTVSNVADRYRGFLRSTMYEVAPGTYVSGNLDAGSRDRIWRTLTGWHEQEPIGSLCLIHPDKDAPAGLILRHLGYERRQLVEEDGHLLLKANKTKSDSTEF